MPVIRIPLSGESALAQNVAHMLNNIAVSLFGFTELAAENASGRPPPTALAELRLGVARVMQLASVLESLAAVDGTSTTVAVADCVASPGAAGASEPFDVQWHCEPSTVVEADPDRIRLALRTLAQLCALRSTSIERHIVAVDRVERALPRCSHCGRDIPDGGLRLTMALDRIGELMPGGARKSRRRGGGLADLMFAASGRLTHLGGGHLVLVTAESSVLVVLPDPSAAIG